MKADLTRSTFDPTRHYRSVLMQQGRVQLDADWNEQQDIVDHRIEAETRDVLGPLAAPLDGNGFELAPVGSTIAIGQGHVYVDGVLCENDEDQLTIDTQTDLPPNACVRIGDSLQALPAPPGVYAGFIHVWQRHITALEDPAIREIALGGPDTATRVKTVWQVQLLQVSADSTATLDCASDLPPWDALTRPPTGTLAARAEPAPDADNPCKLSPTAGYRRLDNLLYRVEMHLMDGVDPAFKWSHDNGSIVSSWLGSAAGSAANELDLSVATLGRDSVLSFGPGQWVELFDDATELLGRAGTLVQVKKAQGDTVTIDVTPADVFPAGAPTAFAAFGRNPRIRRWDGWDFVRNATSTAPAKGWLELEAGVQIQFFSGASTFRHGDYWTIPARTATQVATATVEWPVDGLGVPLYRAPDGVEHHYGKLGVLHFAQGKWTVLDCRPLFPALTELTTLSYVGGDAQVIFEGDPLLLPRPLEVGVENGSFPVAAATVRFSVESGVLANGLAVQDVAIGPSDQGIAHVAWTIDGSVPHQYARAELLDAGVPSTTRYLPVHFSASLIAQGTCACTICVTPAQQEADPNALQRAIDTVIKRGGGVVCLEIGDYAIRKPLQIAGATHLTMCGEGDGSRLLSTLGLIEIRGSEDVVLERFALGSTSVDAAAEYVQLTAVDVDGLRLEHLDFAAPGPSDNAVAARFTGRQRRLHIEDCTVAVPWGFIGDTENAIALDGLTIVGCVLQCTRVGVAFQLQDFQLPVDVRSNRFEQCVAALDIVAESSRRAEVVVADNDVSASGWGVRVIASAARLCDNVVKSLDSAALNNGVLLSALSDLGGEFIVSGNRITGFSWVALSVSTGSGTIGIHGNRIAGGAFGISVAAGSDTAVAIEANQLSDVDVTDATLVAFKTAQLPALANFVGVVGIMVTGATDAIVAGNTLCRIGQGALRDEMTVYGIVVDACNRAKVAGNEISALGPTGGFASRIVGIGAFPPLGTIDISGNQIAHDAGATAKDNSRWVGIDVSDGASIPLSNVNVVPASAAVVLAASRFVVALALPPSTLALLKKLVPTAMLPLKMAVGARTQTFMNLVEVRANQIVARGVSPVVAIGDRAGFATFSENHCMRTSSATAGIDISPAVLIMARTVIASQNTIVPTESGTIGGQNVAMNLSGSLNMMTFIGNIANAPIFVNGAAVPAGSPWPALNVTI